MSDLNCLLACATKYFSDRFSISPGNNIVPPVALTFNTQLRSLVFLVGNLKMYSIYLPILTLLTIAANKVKTKIREIAILRANKIAKAAIKPTCKPEIAIK